MNDCRSGKHRYGSPQSLSGGILRLVCASCGAVSIDITGTDEVEEAHLFPSPGRGEHAR